MSDNFYTTTTAALKATKADIRNLNAQEIKLKDKNILDYIKGSEFDSYDTRDPQLKNDELDIWNTEISLSEEGYIEVKPKEHTYEEMIDEQKELLLNNAARVIDNEVLDSNGNHLMYWQTDGLTESRGMFTLRTSLTSFNSDLSSLTDGNSMFVETSLTSFNGNLSSLMDGGTMFQDTPLTSFNSALPSLTYGAFMFAGTSITSFNFDLPSLTEGAEMFSGCDITSFKGNLSNLTSGIAMFANSTNLVSFNSALPSLTDGGDMFYCCKLDAPSVANIIHTLPTHESNGVIYIGIGCNETEADLLLFAQECDCDTLQELLDDFSAKNWTVYFECNGRPTEAATYGMRRGATLPVYAKLEEVIMPTNENERKSHYAYISQDGSKFYNINYFHSTNGSTEGYDVFSSLEEAISTYNVTPKN